MFTALCCLVWKSHGLRFCHRRRSPSPSTGGRWRIPQRQQPGSRRASCSCGDATIASTCASHIPRSRTRPRHSQQRHPPARDEQQCEAKMDDRKSRQATHNNPQNMDESYDLPALTTMSTMQSMVALATFRRVPVFCGRSDEVRVRIAPATIACQHIRSAFFNRAILAVPMHIAFASRGHRAPGSLLGLRRL